MKSNKYYLVVSFLVFLSFADPAQAFSPTNLSSQSSGKIFLDVDNKGEAWYINPLDFHRYYLGRPMDAFNLMRNLSIGISNTDFQGISSSTPTKLRGRIIIKVQDLGKAYYVNPETANLVYLGRPSDAFNLMRKESQGIKDADLMTIPIGKLVLDSTGKEVDRVWQYRGFWAKVNINKVRPLMIVANYSSATGTLYLGNTVKVVKMLKKAGRVWYQIDGGQYFGSYVDSQFVSPMAQPAPASLVTIPTQVKKDSYWVDVNLSKKLLTLYLNNQVDLVTYISSGNIKTPTIIGSYGVWYKIKKTRMRGAPPIATHVYDLLDVPWVMYYKGSYSLHGTYWHDDFGTQRSAGCTNMTIGDAKYVFDKTKPLVGNADFITPSVNNPGMIVYNHY